MVAVLAVFVYHRRPMTAHLNWRAKTINGAAPETGKSFAGIVRLINTPVFQSGKRIGPFGMPPQSRITKNNNHHGGPNLPLSRHPARQFTFESCNITKSHRGVARRRSVSGGGSRNFTVCPNSPSRFRHDLRHIHLQKRRAGCAHKAAECIPARKKDIEVFPSSSARMWSERIFSKSPPVPEWSVFGLRAPWRSCSAHRWTYPLFAGFSEAFCNHGFKKMPRRGRLFRFSFSAFPVPRFLVPVSQTLTSKKGAHPIS